MKRAGGGLLAVLAMTLMLVGGWLGLRPYLFRETAVLLIVRPDQEPAPYADAVEDGVRLAVEERDHRAGRFRIKLDVYRDATFVFTAKPPALTVNTIVFRHPGVPVFVTAGPEAGVGPTGGIPGNENVAVISATDTHPRDPSASCTAGPASYYRVLPDDRVQASAAADWALQLGARTVYVLTEKHNARSEILAFAFATRAARLGFERVDQGEVDSLEPTLSAHLLDRTPDLVFFAGEEPPYETAHAIGTKLKQAGFTGRLMIADAWPTLSYLLVPRATEGTYLISPFPPVPEAFRKRFRERFNRRAGPHNFSGYLAGCAALEAIDRANSPEPGRVRAACAELSGFDRYGDTTDVAPSRYVLRNGVFEPVE